MIFVVFHTLLYTRSHDRSENGDSIFVRKVFGFISQGMVAVTFTVVRPSDLYTEQ